MMRSPTARLAALLLTLLTASLLLAACGDDDGASSSGDSTPAKQATDTSTDDEGDAADTAGGGAGGTTLTATVGPGFDISLTDADGEDVTSLPAGDYTIEVSDQSDIHNFHLSGPGVDEATEVGESGSDTWKVTLATGDYTFVCDPHASTMKGSFTVA